MMLDMFTGTDGGGEFVKFRTLIENLDRLALEGDQPAIQLMDVFHRFARLAQYAKDN